jgi:hypothetical protein
MNNRIRLGMLFLCVFVGFLSSCAHDRPAMGGANVTAGKNGSLIIVKRDKSFVGSLGKIKILIDGNHVATVRNGEEISFVILNGTHTIKTVQTESIIFEANSKIITFFIDIDIIDGVRLKKISEVALE